MRIARVTETFYPATDCTTRTVRAVADRRVDTGHEVLVVAPAPGLTSYRGNTIARIRTIDRAGAQVREALDRFGPDVVHITSPGAVGRTALEHAHRVGTPIFVVEQSPLLDVAADYWRTRVADRAGAVVVTSRRMVDRVADFGVRAALGDGPQRAWLVKRLPRRPVHRCARHRRADRRTPDARRGRAPRRARDLLPRSGGPAPAPRAARPARP
jgi:hypothetical protein